MKPQLRFTLWIAGIGLLLAAGALTSVSGCGGPSLAPGFGEGTQFDDTIPESFELVWQTFDQLTQFKLVRDRDPHETGLVDDPVTRNEAPKELRFEHEINLPQARDKVVFLLENWMDDLEIGGSWQHDPLVDGLRPYVANNNPELKRLPELSFDYRDFDYLQQCIWAREISHWSQSSAVGPLAESAIAQVEAAHAAEEAKQFVTAIRLFDWTVRNIHLDPPLPEPNDVTAAPGGDATRTAPMSGIPGPGYTMHPWQVLLFGHGDAWQRARVFVLLARQAGIDVVILAENDPGPAGKHKPWLPAALIGDELYLFDAALGLPLPGADGKPVATLDEVRKQPELLRKLDVDDGGGETLAYPMTAERLASLVALVDAEAPALSRRMWIIEQNLSGNRKMMLTVSPARIRERLGDLRTYLWNVPLTATQYQVGRNERAQHDRQVFAQLLYEGYMFGTMTPTCTGRHTHLLGRFEQKGDNPGAKKWYMDARAADADIARLKFSSRMQRELGIARQEGESEQQYQQRLEAAAEGLRKVKHQVTVWLAQVTYETNHFGSSANWLDLIEVKDGDPEYPNVQIGLARAYEANGQIDKARLIYLLDQSPQRHGNRIRARLLRERELERRASNEESE